MQIKRRISQGTCSAWSNVSPLVQRLYMARGLDETKANIDLSQLLPYHSLLNIEAACVRLAAALEAQQRIIVIGDFDADGATATALAVSALQTMGAKNVSFLVPNRFLYGYGLTVGIVDKAASLNPDLLLTVDNGIANHDGVAHAKQLGIDVLITDHHLAAETLPQADVIVNPNQPGCLFESKSIAGVGVVFYLMSALRRYLDGKQWFQRQQLPLPNMAQFLDLVALGTVADVVPLDRNNRIMVKHGLQRIRAGQARPGILALTEIAGRNHQQLKASDLGFSLAPRLNAAGRLDDMSLGIHCLLCPDLDAAIEFAKKLDMLNQERRQIEAEMQAQALAELQDAFACVHQKNHGQHGIVLYQATWHQGVIGILAGRIKEKFQQPTIVFAKGEGGEIKGSARSIVGINIRDVLASIDGIAPGLLLKFGGHAMAAGLAIEEARFQEFSNLFYQAIARLDTAVDHLITSDGPLLAHELTLDTAQAIADAGPWGQQFPEPLFDNVFQIVEQRVVGQHHLKLLLQAPEQEIFYDAIAFNIDLALWPNYRARWVHLTYHLDINEYQGRRRLQFLVKNFVALEEQGAREILACDTV